MASDTLAKMEPETLFIGMHAASLLPLVLR